MILRCGTTGIFALVVVVRRVTISWCVSVDRQGNFDVVDWDSGVEVSDGSLCEHFVFGIVGTCVWDFDVIVSEDFLPSSFSRTGGKGDTRRRSPCDL
jgi:hypothetical protein